MIIASPTMSYIPQAHYTGPKAPPMRSVFNHQFNKNKNNKYKYKIQNTIDYNLYYYIFFIILLVGLFIYYNKDNS